MIRTFQILVQAIAIALFSLAMAGPARACSMDIESVRPSNYELVQMADAIVVATAVRHSGGNGRTFPAFRIESTLKGSPPATVEAPYASLQVTRPSDPNAPYPVAAMGSCGDRPYDEGKRYLLLLTRLEGGGWKPLDYGFAEAGEEYAGEASPWTRTVRRYIQLQNRFRAMAQLEKLKQMLKTREGLAGETLSEAELGDIREHLQSLSPYKPTLYLLAAWNRLERGEQPDFGIGPAAAGTNEEAAGPAGGVSSKPVHVSDMSRQRRNLLLALVNGDHPDALPLFNRLAASPSTVPGELGPALRFFAKNGQYPRAYQWIETRLMNLLPTLPEREAKTLIEDVDEVQDGDSSDEGHERWRRDRHAAANWPELALALHWYQVRFFGEDSISSTSEAIGAIRVPDYRARPFVTLALAADFDANVSRWAMAELKDQAKRRAWEARPVDPDWPPPAEDDPAWLPLMALLTAWTAEKEQFLADIFCQSESRRHLLISMLGTEAEINYSDVLERIAATPTLTQAERGLLAEAIVRFVGRRDGRMDISLEDGPTRILERLRIDADARPAAIVCSH